ncbi:MAG: tRNA (adenine-N1)-methyltransferase [Actinomycetota bacterium]|nr:tRNA (adenine-N1)-methyltransferase [Actinomycetota bacterium]
MTARGPFRAGERVLLIDARQRRYLVTLATGRDFHSHVGITHHDDIIGREEGVLVASTSGTHMQVFRPTLQDYVLKMKRGAQVVYPKDIGLILVNADVYPGATVVEAGTGSGSLTLALARATGEAGRVISFEARDDHHEQAVANINAWYQSFGQKPENLELRVADIFEAEDLPPVDRLILDLPEPWRAVSTTDRFLVPGGIFCAYLPTIPQVSQTVETLRPAGYAQIATFEGLVRTWNVDGQSVRPDHRMVAHTGFLITARKTT